MLQTRFRVMPNAAILSLLLTGMVGCADGLHTDPAPTHEASARLEQAAFAHGVADPELVDESRVPEVSKYGEPGGLFHDRVASDTKADAHDTEEDPRFVRETGFREVFEAPDEVRETGFLPAPALRLVAVFDGRAFLTWSAVEGADKYLMMGMRYDTDGRPVESFAKDFRTQHGWVDGRGFLTRVRVTAVSADHIRRSKASNEVEVPVEDP